MPTYKAVIVGLTGIGARRASEPVGLPIYGAMPRSHAAAYHRHPQTEVVAVCDIRQEALDSFQREWADIWREVWPKKVVHVRFEIDEDTSRRRITIEYPEQLCPTLAGELDDYIAQPAEA